MTKAQWQKVMGTKPWEEKNNVLKNPDSPAVYVSCYDAERFIKALNEAGGGGFRLPTEAEWEYACRAGTHTPYHFGAYQQLLVSYAWVNENTWSTREEYAHPVKQKFANNWKLHDMYGNVYEWCADWYGEYTVGSVVDPQGSGIESKRVMRGGAWNSTPEPCRSAARKAEAPEARKSTIGFRLCRSPQE